MRNLTMRLGPLGWAAAMVAAALLVQVALHQRTGGVAPLATFYLAVTLAALFGGRIAGYLTMILGVTSAVYFLMEPAFELAVPRREDLFRIGFFIVNGVILTEVCGRYGGALASARQLRDEAVRSTRMTEAIEQQLRLALRAGRMAMWDHDAIANRLTTSPELNALLGFPEDHPLTIEEVRANYLPGERERLLADVAAALERGELYAEGELRYRHPDGSVRTFVISAEIVLNAAGEFARTTGVLLDITHLRSTEQSLSERESELKAALDAGKLATVDFDHRTGRFGPSPRLNELYAYPPDHKLTLEDVRARYHPAARDQVFEQRDREAADPRRDKFHWTIRLLLPGERERWVEGVGEYLRDEAGGIARSRGVVMDVTERILAERHQNLLIAELNHRVKNTLAVVQSIARHSFRGAEQSGEVRAFEERLAALARAHNLLTRKNWEGATIGEVVEESIRPFLDAHSGAFDIAGPPVEVSPKTAVNLALALTELGTNAVKYGALSEAGGMVRIEWMLPQGSGFRLCWSEHGGPAVAAPERKGFGTRMIERALAVELEGEVELAFRPEGVTCTVTAATLPRPR